MKCIKCDSDSKLILRKKDPYCEICFLSSTNHKFRACIGKNKILSKNEKVLLCLSGGPGSTALLDLVHHGTSLDIHKKLRITPFTLHVTGASNCSVTNSIKAQCEKYNFDVNFIHISDYLRRNSKLSDVNILPEDNNEIKEEFQSILKSMPPTACNDFLNKVKRRLFIKCARLLGCKYVFTGETTSTLAINLLSNLAVGRGSQVEHDIGFIDSRDDDIKILRPMKDISKEELDYYINLKHLHSLDLKDVKSNSLQTAISSFVTDLQENFQSTVSAVCRTADKIGVGDYNEEANKCAICESILNNNRGNSNLSALDATIFSRTVSHGKLQHENGAGDQKLFPYINEHLCYSCSRNYSEINNTSHHLHNIIQQSISNGNFQ